MPQLKRARLRRHTRGAFPGAVRGRSRCTAHLPRSPPLPPPALEESPAPSARRTPPPPAREKHKCYLLEKQKRFLDESRVRTDFSRAICGLWAVGCGLWAADFGLISKGKMMARTKSRHINRRSMRSTDGLKFCRRLQNSKSDLVL